MVTSFIPRFNTCFIRGYKIARLSSHSLIRYWMSNKASYAKACFSPCCNSVGWLVGYFGLNGPLRQYFSLYRAVSQRERERKEKWETRENLSKQPPPAPTASAVGPCPTIIQIRRTSRHWKLTQHHRGTRPPRYLYLKGKTGKYIHGELADVYESSAPTYAQVKLWVGEFKRGRTSWEDEARSGRPLDATEQEIQSTLVISTSVISNNRLSRRENRVLL